DVEKSEGAGGLASRFEMQDTSAVGVGRQQSTSNDTFGTGTVPDDVIVALIKEHFDMRPAAIIRDLDLLRPIYRQVAAYGHFGRDDLDVPWERTDKADTLRAAAGLEEKAAVSD